MTEIDTYDKFISELTSQWEKFVAEAVEGKTNKSAALRARKASLGIRRNLQEFREISIAHDKQ